MSYDLSNTLFTPSDQFDDDPKDAAVLNPANGSVITTFAFPVAFTGDILANGIFASAIYDTVLGAFVSLKIYDHNTNLLTTIDSSVLTGLDATTNNFIAVSAHEPSTFYVAWSGDTGATGITKVISISDAGVPGGTTWTLPNTSLSGNMPPQCTAMGVSISGQYLYYSDGILNGSLIQAIHKYDLFSSTIASDFTSTGGHINYYGQLALVQSNDDVIVLLQTGGAGSDNFVAKRYDSSGTLQQTYTLVADAGAFDDPILARGPDPLYFWVHTFEDGSGNTASYTQVKISDGSTPVSWTINSRNSGLTNIPLSCPFFIFSSGYPTTLTGTLSVVKLTISSPDPSTKFVFIANNGLSPATFELGDGETQEFSEIPVGSSYQIVETVISNWNTNIVVSNGTTGGIVVTTGVTTTITFTNIFTGPFSGIYFIHPAKTNDTLYSLITPTGTTSPPTVSTIVVAIPNPFIVL